MMTVVKEMEKFRNLADFKYGVETYFGSDLTQLSNKDSDEVAIKKADDDFLMAKNPPNVYYFVPDCYMRSDRVRISNGLPLWAYA